MSAQPNMSGEVCLNRQRGLTLIELMVAIVIGLILTAGVLQIFIGSQQTYRFQESLSRIQENGRFALETLARDLRGADYRGCGGHSTELNTILKGGFSEDYGFGGEGLRGHTYNGGWTPALDAELAAQDPDQDSDIIRAFTADGAGVRIIDQNFKNANLDLEPGGGDRFNEGDIVWATDCRTATEFQITNVQQDATKLVHASNPTPPPGNQSPPQLPPYTGGQVLSFNARAFYVAPSASDASNEPALFRLDRGGTPQELVEGVERMSLMFGEDTSGNRQVNRYRTAEEIESDDAWSNVVAVRVSLLVRGRDENVTEDPQAISFPPGSPVQTFDDRRLRQVFTTTVGIRNRLQ